MPAIDYFLRKGYTPQNRLNIIQESAAVAVWTPKTSMRVVITDITISSSPATTIAFYWGNVAGDKIAEFLLAGSATITPSIGIWEGTAYDRSLFAVSKVGATDGIRVDLTGFEIPFF